MVGDGRLDSAADTVSVTANWIAVSESIWTADSVSFNMTYVPDRITYMAGYNDTGDITYNDVNTDPEDEPDGTIVPNAFQIAQTEVTYKLWYAVYSWATVNEYVFSNAGTEGHDGTAGAAPTAADKEPVTSINWRDAMVWPNALTEY
ncbi:MAG: SUMF1/EgtB/PvdO family nonheme iron enzyme [Deltaproteobacteria bacterium]|nr:SUMF1/EgtB/PvdO family nonheme iron enzyme [Deltaproteobacteria bacterium]